MLEKGRKATQSGGWGMVIVIVILMMTFMHISREEIETLNLPKVLWHYWM
jgi:hypothetical protein